MKISVKECADTLKEKDNILILTHANPDGDTLGSGFALCRALMKIGKICAVINADDIPKKYNYLFDDIVEIKFKPDYVVAVDVATVKLLGGLEEQYKIDMCIDHHSTNTEYANLLLLEDAPAACQIMYEVVLALGVEVDKKIADCLYTGLTTDTGCFRYVLPRLRHIVLRLTLLMPEQTTAGLIELCLKQRARLMQGLKGLLLNRCVFMSTSVLRL